MRIAKELRCINVMTVVAIAALLVVTIVPEQLFSQNLSKRARPDLVSPSERDGNQDVPMVRVTPGDKLDLPPINPGTVTPLGYPITSPLTSIIPVIDGIKSAGEWDDALSVNVGYYGGQPDVKMWVKNDCRNLYMLFQDKRLNAATYAQYGNHSLNIAFAYDLGTSKNPDYTYCTPGYREGIFSIPDLMANYPTGPGSDFAAQDGPYYGGWWATCFYVWWAAQTQAGAGLYPKIEWMMKYVAGTGGWMEIRIPFESDGLNATIAALSPETIGIYIMVMRAVLGMPNYYYFDGIWGTTNFAYTYIYPYSWLMTKLTLSAPTSPGFLTSFTNFDLNPGVDGYYVYNANSSMTFHFDMASDPTQTATVNWKIRGKLPATTLISSGSQVFNPTPVPQTFSFTVPLTGLMRGFYDLYADVVYEGECGTETKSYQFRFMVKDANEGYCVVWPGDLNDDGAANFNDQNYLNQYIFNSNLDPNWLYGPRRFRTGLVTEDAQAMDIFTWEPQPALLWYYPQSCYVDADGNGMIHNFDLWGVKINMGKTHGTPKENVSESPTWFSLDQNFPNPFNPSTVISYYVPEASSVTIKVMDMLGREVAVLQNGPIGAGYHSVEWMPGDLPTGLYLCSMIATGSGTGITYSKTMKMTYSR